MIRDLTRDRLRTFRSIYSLFQNHEAFVHKQKISDPALNGIEPAPRKNMPTLQPNQLVEAGSQFVGTEAFYLGCGYVPARLVSFPVALAVKPWPARLRRAARRSCYRV